MKKLLLLAILFFAPILAHAQSGIYATTGKPAVETWCGVVTMGVSTINHLMGPLGGTISAFPVGMPSGGGTTASLRLAVDVAPGAGEGDTLTLYKNGVATNMVAIISGGTATSGADTTHAVTFARGDVIAVKPNYSGSSNSSIFGWQITLK